MIIYILLFYCFFVSVIDPFQGKARLKQIDL